MIKLFRVTTVSLSLNTLLKGQLSFLNHYFDVTGIASGEKDELKEVSQREGVRTINIPMCRQIDMLTDLQALVVFIFLFIREKPHIVHTNTPKASLLSCY